MDKIDVPDFMKEYGATKVSKEELIRRSTTGRAEVFKAMHRKEKIKKLKQRLLMAFLVGSLAIGMTIYDVNHINESEANDFMDTKMVSYLEQSGVPYAVKYNDVDLLIARKDIISRLVERMQQDGFKMNEILYGVRETLGREDADKIAKAYGYLDLEDYIEKRYTGIIGAEMSSEEQFENSSKSGYVDNVTKLMEQEKKKVSR